MTFDHVTDPVVLAVLNGDISEDAICQALTRTGNHLAKDLNDESIDPAALKHRINTYNDAYEAWNQEGDIDGCLESLKEYWS